MRISVRKPGVEVEINAQGIKVDLRGKKNGAPTHIRVDGKGVTVDIEPESDAKPEA